MRTLLTLPLVALTWACASGNETLYPDHSAVILDLGPPAQDGYMWPDLGPPPDAFVWPDGLPDASIYDDGGVVDGAPPPADAAPACPDPYEPNAVCATAKSLGSTKEGSSWLSKTATSSPSNDVDWYMADGTEGSNFCFPGTTECFNFKVRVDVPAGRRLKVCVMKESCTAGATCADNGTNPGPTQLNVKYGVSGTCALDDDTKAVIWVEQLDALGDCDAYTIAVNYDEC